MLPIRNARAERLGRSNALQELVEEGGQSTLPKFNHASFVVTLHIGPLVALSGPNGNRNNNDRPSHNRANNRGPTCSRETVVDWARGPGASPTTDVRRGDGGERAKGHP